MSRCVPLYGVVAPRSGIPHAEPIKTAVNAQFEAGSEKKPQFLLAADTFSPNPKLVVESEPAETEIMAEKKQNHRRSQNGNPGDELTGKVGIMGGEEPTRETTPPPSARPEPTGDVIYIELQPTPTKDSTPPPYKQNATNP